MTSRVLHAIDRARAAVVGAGLTPIGEALHTDPKYTEANYFKPRAIKAVDDVLSPPDVTDFINASITTLHAAQAPSWPVQRPQDPPVPRVLPSIPSAADLRAGLHLSRGAARLHDLLRDVAADVARHRAYEVMPSAITYHLPAVALAVALNYTERHLYRLADELADLGLIACGAHAQRVGMVNRWSGTLWKVALTPGHRPRILADEWRHRWAPEFHADYYGKTGARAELSGLQSLEPRTDELRGALARRAAAADGQNPPLLPSPDNRRPADLHGIAHTLRELVNLHPARRHDRVTELADGIAQALGEPGRFRQWCRALYTALTNEQQLRPGVAHLEAQLHRLAADLTEGAPWRTPGAVLAARLA